MNTTAEKAIETLGKWAEEDSDNRAVIVIAFEKQKESQDGARVNLQAEQQNLKFGDRKNLILALTTALSEDNNSLARLVAVAVSMLQNSNFKNAVVK